jgi:hypothetical protein
MPGALALQQAPLTPQIAQGPEALQSCQQYWGGSGWFGLGMTFSTHKWRPFWVSGNTTPGRWHSKWPRRMSLFLQQTASGPQYGQGPVPTLLHFFLQSVLIRAEKSMDSHVAPFQSQISDLLHGFFFRVLHGSGVGLCVGVRVKAEVGVGVGAGVGLCVGVKVMAEVGIGVGAGVGLCVGAVGLEVGLIVGAFVGAGVVLLFGASATLQIEADCPFKAPVPIRL